jgi:hypothetical protein
VRTLMRTYKEPQKAPKILKNFAIPINLQGRARKNRSTVFGMELKIRVLVANEPRVYREVIADALPKLRPLVEVFLAEPEELEREAMRVRPHLILCSRKPVATLLAQPGPLLAWMVLYPEGEDRAEVGGGATSERAALLLEGVALEDLLRMVDEIEQLLLLRRPAYEEDDEDLEEDRSR